MIINKLDRLNIQRQSGSGNYRIIATVRDTVDGIDNQFNELNSQNSNLIVSNRYNVVTKRDCTSIFFSGNIGDIFTITYQQWVVLLGEESYYDILIDTIVLQETTKLYYFRDDLVVDSYSIGEVDALLALKANIDHTHTIADIDDLNTTLSIIESDILLKADIDHNHDADYHPLNGSVNVGNGSWVVTGSSGLLFAVEQDNNNVFSTVPIYDESVSPRQGIIHLNRPNLDAIDQDLSTTANVQFLSLQCDNFTNFHINHGVLFSVFEAIELGENSTGDRNCLIDFHSSDNVDYSFRIIREPSTNGRAIFYQTGIGEISLEASSSVQINGNCGFLLPRLTTTQRNTLTPSNGMMIYNTTDNKFQGYANGSWVDLH